MTWEGLHPPYRCIVADPPWRLTSAGVTKADARKFYSTLSAEDVAALPVGELVDPDGTHLWLWALNALMGEAHEVVRAWGFSPLTIVTWCKPGPGVGHYLRNSTEHVILASKGKPMTPETKPLSTWYQWPRGAHSAKPAASYDLVEQVSPGPRVELFARQPRLGWDSWGYGFEGAAATARARIAEGRGVVMRDTKGLLIRDSFPRSAVTAGRCGGTSTPSPGRAEFRGERP